MMTANPDVLASLRKHALTGFGVVLAASLAACSCAEDRDYTSPPPARSAQVAGDVTARSASTRLLEPPRDRALRSAQYRVYDVANNEHGDWVAAAYVDSDDPRTQIRILDVPSLQIRSWESEGRCRILAIGPDHLGVVPISAGSGAVPSGVVLQLEELTPLPVCLTPKDTAGWIESSGGEEPKIAYQVAAGQPPAEANAYHLTQDIVVSAPLDSMTWRLPAAAINLSDKFVRLAGRDLIVWGQQPGAYGDFTFRAQLWALGDQGGADHAWSKNFWWLDRQDLPLLTDGRVAYPVHRGVWQVASLASGAPIYRFGRNLANTSYAPHDTVLRQAIFPESEVGYQAETGRLLWIDERDDAMVLASCDVDDGNEYAETVLARGTRFVLDKPVVVDGIWLVLLDRPVPDEQSTYAVTAYRV
jgi:hypothetical protein